MSCYQIAIGETSAIYYEFIHAKRINHIDFCKEDCYILLAVMSHSIPYAKCLFLFFIYLLCIIWQFILIAAYFLTSN